MEPIRHISQSTASLLTPKLAFELNVLPLDHDGDTLTVGAANPEDQSLINDLSFYTGLKIITKSLPSDFILRELKKLYAESLDDNNDEHIFADDLAAEYSNIEFVDKLIKEAIKSKASDIHLERYEDIFRVRYRIDGQLREVLNLAVSRSASIISRVKIMAGMDISEKRKPQDGRIKFKYENKDIDIRVSTLPTGFGEKIVLRILDKSNVNLDIEELGFTRMQLDLLKNKIHLPYGMILVTGPTGSGKTTTLYAALKHIHSVEKNITTIEDPIEYNLTGINQCNVKPEIGFDFGNALRAFLRQDPDIIMVGEIRDKTTADIAIRAALTGHLVFSTLHTNDSISALTRLTDMGIEPFLVAASLKLIIAQRLVRKLCECKTQAGVNSINSNTQSNYIINGCIKCGFTGYSGRIALLELLEITEELEEMISKNISISEIKKYLTKSGFRNLHKEGIDKVKLGITSYEEVNRETLL